MSPTSYQHCKDTWGCCCLATLETALFLMWASGHFCFVLLGTNLWRTSIWPSSVSLSPVTSILMRAQLSVLLKSTELLSSSGNAAVLWTLKANCKDRVDSCWKKTQLLFSIENKLYSCCQPLLKILTDFNKVFLDIKMSYQNQIISVC